MVLVAACASYPERTASALSAFERGQFEAALASYRDEDVTDAPFLAGVEAGTVALTAGRWEEALECFRVAAREVRDREQRGLLEPGSLAESARSWLFNDRSLPYEGEGFERVMLHCCMALAYLALGRVQDVGVEARLANRLLESEEELYETEYRAGGMGHFLSAVVYELAGEYDQAYIDYERMVRKNVGVDVAGPALVRITRDLARLDQHERWSERFGPPAERPVGAASVVVIAGVGLGPYKVEQRINVPLPGGIFSWAAPRFEERPQVITGLRLVAPDAGFAVRTAVVEDVTEVSVRNLRDRLAWIAAKSAARGVAKRELTGHLEDEYGVEGRIVGELFSVLTERADLRSWLTLPDTWQACRLFVPPGVHDLQLDAVGGPSADLGRFELEAGETMFVLARTVGGRLYAHPVGGVPVEPRS